MRTRLRIVIAVETFDDGMALDRAWREFLDSEYGRRLRDALRQHNFEVVGLGYEKANGGG